MLVRLPGEFSKNNNIAMKAITDRLRLDTLAYDAAGKILQNVRLLKTLS